MITNLEDFPTIQAGAILAGNAYAVMGDAKDIPVVAELLAAQQVEISRAQAIYDQKREELEAAERTVMQEEGIQRNVSKYLRELVEESAKEAIKND